MTIKVGMISLGCSKNQVDAERLLAMLAGEGFSICNDTPCGEEHQGGAGSSRNHYLVSLRQLYGS